MTLKSCSGKIFKLVFREELSVMKKLIINGLLLIAIIFVICALVWGFSRLRAVDEKEQQLQENRGQHEQNTTQKTDSEITQVKVNGESTTTKNTKDTQTTSKPATTDEDVNDFWSDIG